MNANRNYYDKYIFGILACLGKSFSISIEYY